MRAMDKPVGKPGARTTGPSVIELLPENVPALRVFIRCRFESVPMTVVVGDKPVIKMVWLPLSAAEIHSACLLLGVPPKRWPRLVDRVQFLGQVYAQTLNE